MEKINYIVEETVFTDVNLPSEVPTLFTKDEIVKVKKLDGVYSVNGNFFIPANTPSNELDIIQEWLNQGNELEPEFTQAELLEIKTKEYTTALDTLVQNQINTYNQIKGTVFENIASCALYATSPKQRPHDPFCEWVWLWKDDIFEYAGNMLLEVKQGSRQMPNSAELVLNEILEHCPIKTQEFIGE